MNCSNCSQKIGIGECYGENWCRNCHGPDFDQSAAFVNIMTPFDAEYQYVLAERGTFKFNMEIDSPEMRGE